MRVATRYHCVVLLFQALSHSTNDGETYVYVATLVYQLRIIHASSLDQDHLAGQMLVVTLVLSEFRIGEMQENEINCKALQM